jgi:hypothetical protein
MQDQRRESQAARGFGPSGGHFSWGVGRFAAGFPGFCVDGVELVSALVWRFAVEFGRELFRLDVWLAGALIVLLVLA